VNYSKSFLTIFFTRKSMIFGVYGTLFRNRENS